MRYAPPAGGRETDVDLVKAAIAVVPAGSLQYDPTRGHASIVLFEFGDAISDSTPDFGSSGHALKIDLDRRLHAAAPDV
jgi:hypothetical protein